MAKHNFKKLLLTTILVGVVALIGVVAVFAQEDGNFDQRVTVNGYVWAANGLDDSLSLIDLHTGETVNTTPAGINPHILTISPDGAILYVINAGEHDRDPSAHSDEPSAEQASTAGHSEDMGDQKESTSGEHGHGGGADSMESTANGSGMGMGDSGVLANSLWALDSLTGEVLAQIPVGAGPTHPIASADGEWVYVTNTDEGSVSVVSTASWEVVETINELPEPHDGELTPDGRLLYLATAGTNTMTVVDTATREVLNTFAIGQKPRGLAVGGDNGELAYVSNKADGTLSVIDVPAGEIVGTYPVGEGAHALRVSPDGSLIYISLSTENAIAIVDAATGEVLSKIAVGDGPEQIDVSTDGRWLLAGNNREATVSIVDLATETVINTAEAGNGVYGVQAVTATAEDTASLQFEKNADGYAEISVQQLASVLEDTNVTLVNVHIPYGGDIPGTDLSIPYDQVVQQLDQLPKDDSVIALYCRSGSMSTVAANALVDVGYTNVVEVDGGFNAWQAAGYEMVYSN